MAAKDGNSATPNVARFAHYTTFVSAPLPPLSQALERIKGMKTLNKPKAVSIAVVSFVCFHYLLTMGSNYLANNSENFPSFLPWLNLTAYILYLISGFIAGIFSNTQFLIIGLVSGFLSAISAVFIFGVGGEVFGILITLTSGLVLGGVGGSLSSLLKRKVANAL